MAKKKYTTNAIEILDRRHPPSADDLKARAEYRKELIAIEYLVESLEVIARSEESMKASRGIDAHKGIKQMTKKLGLKLDR